MEMTKDFVTPSRIYVSNRDVRRVVRLEAAGESMDAQISQNPGEGQEMTGFVSTEEHVRQMADLRAQLDQMTSERNAAAVEIEKYKANR